MYRYQPLLFQAVPSRLAYSLTKLLEEERAVRFWYMVDDFEVRFAAGRPLAYIDKEFMGWRKHLVVIHPVLNHPGTPATVLRFICKHELAHLARPGRVIDGAYEPHPPEFWEFEIALCPERDAAWAWIHKNFGRCLRRGIHGLEVTQRWRSLRDSPRTPFAPRLPFYGEEWDGVCPGDGAQLQLPPDWPPRPLPFGMERARLPRVPAPA
jgi:hypothetical protein